MIRGTSTPFKFKSPYSLSELDWVAIKFWQPGNPDDSLPITKYKQHCEERSGEIYVSLSATETAKFSDKYKAKAQLRAQPLYGDVFGSKEKLITVYPMRDDIIEDDTPDVPSEPIVDGWMRLDGGQIVD